MYYLPIFTGLQKAMTNGLQDEVLAKAIDQADGEVRKLKQQVEARRWQMVADNMKTLRVSIQIWSIHMMCLDICPAGCRFLAECMPQSLRRSTERNRQADAGGNYQP